MTELISDHLHRGQSNGFCDCNRSNRQEETIHQKAKDAYSSLYHLLMLFAICITTFVVLVTREGLFFAYAKLCAFVVQYLYGLKISLDLMSGLCVAWSESCEIHLISNMTICK